MDEEKKRLRGMEALFIYASQPWARYKAATAFPSSTAQVIICPVSVLLARLTVKSTVIYTGCASSKIICQYSAV